MAEVAKNVVSEPERPEPEELSLQQLIDTELALRVPPPNKSQTFTLDFLEAEREAAERCAPSSPPLIVIDTVVVQNGTASPSPPSPTLSETSEPSLPPTPDTVMMGGDHNQFVNGDSGGGIGELGGVTDEWTTVEEVALELTGEGGGDRAQAEVSQAQQSPESKLTEITTSCVTNNYDGSTTEVMTTVTTKTTTITTQILQEEMSNHQTSEVETSVTEKKKKKKSVTENGNDASSATKVKKSKKKKTEEKENHISVKSSFSKFDQLSKKTVLHVRSSDPAKASKTFSQGDSQTTSTCKACDKTVFAMEQIKAERAVWHKNCFRCHTCKKQLTVDIYSSHEGLLYCKPHFKDLFKPKVVVEQEEEPVRRRKPEMIIRENQPVELPPDVVRASDKSDLGLKELNLDVKSMFRVFEKSDETDGDLEKSPTTVSVKRSSSIMSKLAKFQKKGMDIGVSEEALNGFVCEETSSSEDDSDEGQENGVIKATRKLERPMSFGKIDDVKKNWESAGDQHERREKLREQKKEELQHLRSRLFMGKQVKMKELYEQAVAESEGKAVKKDEMNDIVRSDKAKVVREKFEKGEPVHSDSEEESKTNKKGINEDISIFEDGFSKKSRSLFLEMDANAAKTPPPSSDMKPKKTKESDSPDREVYRDPDVVRCDEKEDDTALMKSQTTSRMLSMFRQMEEHKEIVPDGPKPKKCFTPPPDFKGSESEESEDEDDDEEDVDEEDESENEDGVVKSSYKVDDEYLKQSKTADRAKQLAAKFESWEPDQQSNNNAINMLDSEHASIDSTKSLRAKFESLKSEQPKEKSRPNVNRFVETTTPTMCAFCEAKVYPLEKIETNGKTFHKKCFRCSYCNCILRMDSYTLNNGHLYCLPHFKQLFISKGNYDEGFGSNQHKRKWETPAN